MASIWCGYVHLSHCMLTAFRALISSHGNRHSLFFPTAFLFVGLGLYMNRRAVRQLQKHCGEIRANRESLTVLVLLRRPVAPSLIDPKKLAALNVIWTGCQQRPNKVGRAI